MELERMHRLAQPEDGAAPLSNVLHGLNAWLTEFNLPPSEIEKAAAPFVAAAAGTDPPTLNLEKFLKAADSCQLLKESILLKLTPPPPLMPADEALAAQEAACLAATTRRHLQAMEPTWQAMIHRLGPAAGRCLQQLQTVNSKDDSAKTWHRYIEFLQTLSTTALMALSKIHNALSGGNPVMVEADLLLARAEDAVLVLVSSSPYVLPPDASLLSGRHTRLLSTSKRTQLRDSYCLLKSAQAWWAERAASIVQKAWRLHMRQRAAALN
eukprot:jgi/Botrbrau1/7192/Bobra.0300s0022.1